MGKVGLVWGQCMCKKLKNVHFIVFNLFFCVLDGYSGAAYSVAMVKLSVVFGIDQFAMDGLDLSHHQSFVVFIQ